MQRLTAYGSNWSNLKQNAVNWGNLGQFGQIVAIMGRSAQFGAVCALARRFAQFVKFALKFEIMLDIEYSMWYNGRAQAL